MRTVLIATLAYAMVSLLVAYAFCRVFRLAHRHEEASNGEADLAGRQVQGLGVHTHSATPEEARHHV